MAEKISNIYKTVNLNLNEEDFISASLVVTEEDRKYYSEKYGRDLVLYREVLELSNKYGINPENIYFTEYGKGIANYLYFNFPVLVEITAFNDDYFGMFKFHERIIFQEKHYKKCMEENNFEEIISLADNRLRVMAINKLYDNIPDDQKYTWMMEVYTLEDYGFTSFREGLVEDAFSKRTEEHKRNLKKNLNSIEDGEELTIYRGQGTESTPIEETHSWTLSYNVACRFSNNFGMNGEVYSAKVKKADVIDYVTDRKEEEIIARPRDVYDVKPLGIIKTEEELDKLNKNFLMGRYHSAIASFNDEWFLHPNGIHGKSHMQRVLLHVLSLSLEKELDDFNQEILIAAALYHDIGRINDDVDDSHGKRSWVKMQEEGIIEMLESEYALYEEEQRVLQFIVENHCLDDDYVWAQLDEVELYSYSKEEVKMLTSIFKDADGLDRVRLGDLESKYLRTEEAKKRINFANSLLRAIK